jgi:hypothetical protein
VVAVLAIGFLALTLSGVPVLGWTLLGVAAVAAVADTARIAAGRQSQGVVERLLPLVEPRPPALPAHPLGVRIQKPVGRYGRRSAQRDGGP